MVCNFERKLKEKKIEQYRQYLLSNEFHEQVKKTMKSIYEHKSSMSKTNQKKPFVPNELEKEFRQCSNLLKEKAAELGLNTAEFINTNSIENQFKKYVEAIDKNL